MRSLFLILLTLPLAAQNWPSFRGANATGVADGKPIPTSFDVPAGRNILWKTPIPGLAFSSPVIWGDKLFATTAISDDPKDFRVGLYGDVEPSKDLARHTWKVYCLDKKSGKILWEQVAHQGIPKSRRHTKNTQATPTPATDGRYLAVWFGSEGLFVYDLNGKLQWKKDLGVMNSGWFFDPDYEWGIAASPIIYKDMVILQVDIQKGSFIAAWDLKTGKERWRTPREEIPSWGTPNIYEGKNRAELVTNATKAIRAYDPMTGKELWKLTGDKFNSETVASIPIFYEDVIYISNGYPPVFPIFAIKAGASGDISLKPNETTNEFVLWSKKAGGTRSASPMLYQGLMYTLSENGVLTCYEPKTGERIYQKRVSQKGSAHSGSPVAANGYLYLPSEDGEVLVVKAGKQFELVAANPVGEWMMASPAISDGVLYIRSANHIIAVGEKQP
ncbi:MAG: PQQ-binding-like beta-propeller repeat protein [Bryobacteraceae bacterium]|nr:PQQ-binding-like beta-propeller repeat protein [Bryobacteraceae bacterium]